MVDQTTHPPKCHSFVGLDRQIGSSPPAYLQTELRSRSFYICSDGTHTHTLQTRLHSLSVFETALISTIHCWYLLLHHGSPFEMYMPFASPMLHVSCEHGGSSCDCEGPWGRLNVQNSLAWAMRREQAWQPRSRCSEWCLEPDPPHLVNSTLVVEPRWFLLLCTLALLVTILPAAVDVMPLTWIDHVQCDSGKHDINSWGLG